MGLRFLSGFYTKGSNFDRHHSKFLNISYIFSCDENLYTDRHRSEISYIFSCDEQLYTEKLFCVLLVFTIILLK